MESSKTTEASTSRSQPPLLENELILYPIDKEYIGKIFVKLPEDETDKKQPVKSELTTIVILDRSGSMGDEVARFVNSILPEVFYKLEYPDDYILHLITFDSIPELIPLTVAALPNYNIDCRGCTQMAGAIEELKKLLLTLTKDQKAVRVLTVSDGMVDDQENTQKHAEELAKFTEQKFEINSQAVRLFTSYCQPDTRAISSVLRLNNLTNVNLLDLSQQLSDDEIINSIVNLYTDDCLTYQIVMNSEENLFKKSPWTPGSLDKITVFPGENIFWVEKVPSKPIKIQDINVTIKIEQDISLETYGELLDKKMQHFMTQLKILKVVNTPEATETIANMVQYFQKCENSILNKETDIQIILNNPGLQSRLQYLKTMILRRNKTYSIRMAEIANDEKVSQLNAAQQADYLRTVDTSKNSRGLARRALNQGIDFNETVRKEVLQMKEHLDDLKNVDDRDHFTSFYSKETTLGGIRAVCELVDQNMLEDLDANDIFLLLNIVGIACSGPIGDYPDAMTWRVNELYYGCYISLSDVLTAYLQSGGTVIKTPATEKDITNVIPLFEDNRILKFLKKYAPSTLEYVCSIGMRRIIAEVPMTCGYTMCAAVWKMIEDLNKNKTELHLKTFERLVNNYYFYVGKYFGHIMPYIKDQGISHNSYYIANNGITNMISPVINLCKNNDNSKIYIPNILRALYTYDIWQAVRRLYKNRENTETIAYEMLTKLLGINIEKNKTNLKPLFEDEPEFAQIQFYDEINLDEEYYKELCKNFYYIRYCTLMPKYFEAVFVNIENISKIPELNQDMIKEALDIDYDIKTFQIYNIFQALCYTTKASRVDTDAETMKILDLKYKEEAEEIIKGFIKKQFEDQYQIDLAEKKKKELAVLADLLVNSILKSNSYEQIVSLMRDGVTKGNVTHKIANVSSLGYLDLKKRLFDTSEVVPLRFNIIKIFLLGTDQNNGPVWNNGGVNFVYNLTEIGKIFACAGLKGDWEKIYAEYKERRIHIYRQKPNYHGHGNEKLSYYAMGYPTLMHYKNDVSDEQFKQYCDIHSECCGVAEYITLIAAK